MNVKFTNKIPQWAIKQTMLGPLQPKTAEAKDKDLIPNKKIVDALKTANKQKNEGQAFNAMASISPSIKKLTEEETNIKKANAASKDKKERRMAVEATKNTATRETLAHSMISNTIKPILSFDEVITEGHSKLQTRSANKAESMFGTEKTKEDTISDLSMASIKANKQNLAKKVARNKTSEEIAEEQKGRKLGEYDPITGMYNANFASAKTATAQQGDQFDVYKMFPTSIMKTQPKNKEMADLSRFLERRMLGKIASTITENKCEWKEATRKEINSRMKKAAESSARTVNNFYENKEKIEKTRIPSEQELKTALNQREFSKRMGLKNEELKQETMKENQKRQAAISRNLKETKKEFKRATAAKPTQDIVNNTLKKMADQQLKNNGVEEI